MKEIKDFLHLYPGVLVKTNHPNYRSATLKSAGTKGCTVHNGRNGNEYFSFVNIEIKPILRPLSDMTEEEAIWVADLAYTDAVAKQQKALIGMAFIQYTFLNKALSADMITSVEEIGTEHAFELTRYLLKQGFDIFGLIESGLAISKTQTQE